MKELYMDAELEIVKLSLVDIITTSDGETLPSDPDEGDLDEF